MINIVAISALFCHAFGSRPLGTTRIDKRIIGGRPVNIEQYPYQISLTIGGEHSCGGSIISRDFIVTAAHCTNARQASEMKIRAGATNWKFGGQVRDVAEIHQHQNFDNVTLDYDIAILTLSQSLKFGKRVQAIHLPSLNQIVPVGADCMVSGWGFRRATGFEAARLRATFVPLISNEECQIAYKDRLITSRMICAGYSEGTQDACQGNF